MKTKILALLLAAMMLLSLCACGIDAKSSVTAEPSAAAEETPAQAPAEDDAETPAAPADAEESTAEQADFYREAVEQCQDMGLAEITEIYQAAYDNYLAS